MILRLMLSSALFAALQAIGPEARAALDLETRATLAKMCAAKGDVLGWGKAVMPHKFTLPFCPLHEYIVETRKAPVQSLKAPRGHSKTTIGCTLVPLYQALEEPRKPFDFYLNIQATDMKALAINRSIKAELESNDCLRYLYGNQVGLRWADEEAVTKGGIVFKAAGAGVSLRGIQYHNRRPNYVRADDLFDEQAIHSIDQTIKTSDWVKSVLYKTLARGRPTVFCVQGTMINKADILLAMEKWPGCTSKTFQALLPNGSSLWPELYTPAQLAEERERLGTIIFNREMQNICTDDSEAIVKSAWLKDWEYDPVVHWARLPQGMRAVGAVLGCDPSTGEKEVGDPAGFCVMVETNGPGSRKDYWIEALENRVLSWDERLSQLERMNSFQNARGPEFRIKRVFIEAIGGFKDFGNQAKLKTGLPVELVTWVKGKKANLSTKSGHFEFGRVHISRAIPQQMRDEIFDQITQNEPQHDDLRDSVLLCLESPVLRMKDWVMG